MGMFTNMGFDITPRLRAIEFLKDVPRRAMRAAGKEAKWFSIPAGKPLYLAGEAADTLYFVLSGTLGVFREGPHAKTEFIGHIRSGEPAGEMSLFLGGVDLTGRGSVRNSTSRSPELGADAGTSTRQRGPSSDFELEITDAPGETATPNRHVTGM